MRKLFLVLLIGTFYSCGQSHQQKAEKLVKKFLDSALNDPHSYEPIQFTTLNTHYVRYELENSEGKRLDALAASYIDTSMKFKKRADSVLYSIKPDFKVISRNEKLDTLYTKKADSISNVIKIKGKGYKGSLEEYSIEHSYRAKNGFGALTVHKTRFVIDTTFTKVKYSQSLD